MSCRVKICGITNIEDAMLAISSGADALGFVFYPPSPRYISISDAQVIVSKLPPFVTPVALFVDAAKEVVAELLDGSPRWCLQFHGQETPEYCEQFGVPYYKALRMKPGLDIAAIANSYPSSMAILLDAYKPGVPGGTGETFDWESIPQGLRKPLILAGGLSIDNVAKAIDIVRPFAVDVSGGVELEPGKKDPDKVRDFIRAAKYYG